MPSASFSANSNGMAIAITCSQKCAPAPFAFMVTWLSLSVCTKSLQQMSASLSGEAEFENLEGQLEIHCSIGIRGTVHLEVSLWDYNNHLKCRFETDPASLDLTIASLGRALG
jgi:hypothetical protein